MLDTTTTKTRTARTALAVIALAAVFGSAATAPAQELKKPSEQCPRVATPAPLSGTVEISGEVVRVSAGETATEVAIDSGFGPWVVVCYDGLNPGIAERCGGLQEGDQVLLQGRILLGREVPIGDSTLDVGQFQEILVTRVFLLQQESVEASGAIDSTEPREASPGRP